MSREEDEEGDGKGDEQEDIGHEEVQKGHGNVLEHLNVLAEPGNFPDQKHLEKKKKNNILDLERYNFKSDYRTFQSNVSCEIEEFYIKIFFLKLCLIL